MTLTRPCQRPPGPRAGVNFNDGTKGGEVLEQNLIMNFVRESGDHGAMALQLLRFASLLVGVLSEQALLQQLVHLLTLLGFFD